MSTSTTSSTTSTSTTSTTSSTTIARCVITEKTIVVWLRSLLMRVRSPSQSRRIRFVKVLRCWRFLLRPVLVCRNGVTSGVRFQDCANQGKQKSRVAASLTRRIRCSLAFQVPGTCRHRELGVWAWIIPLPGEDKLWAFQRSFLTILQLAAQICETWEFDETRTCWYCSIFLTLAVDSYPCHNRWLQNMWPARERWFRWFSEWWWWYHVEHAVERISEKGPVEKGKRLQMVQVAVSDHFFG